MITKIKESKTLIKRISCDCECKSNFEKCKSKQNLNSSERQLKDRKNIMYVKKFMLRNLSYVPVSVIKNVKLMHF